MPRGQLPDPDARRRNAPTIPTTHLPAAGRKGPAPKPPAWIELGKAGKAWWKWAWASPQAAAWTAGDEVSAAHRASLEDDLAALAKVEGLDLADVLDAESAREVKTVIERLARLATGRIAVCREMRELDNRLGLNPKGMADLRWKVVPDAGGPAAKGGRDEVAKRREKRRARLSNAS
jgi:hypothetical protein